MNVSNEPLELRTSTGPEIKLVGLEKPTDSPKIPMPTAEELMQQANTLGEQLRALIVLTKKLPRDKNLESHQDPTRSLALAQAHLQTGFMWLRRAIDAPKIF